MDNPINKERIFLKELLTLKEKNYISSQDYQTVSNSYKRYQEDLKVEYNQAILNNQVHKTTAEPKVKKEPKPKKVLTADQIRERNITWSLILGVILLLIGGLVVATSNWSDMSPLMKVLSVGLVSIFFLGLSWISGRLLKIDKTSFAFLTLGSLFIPIVVLSIGYFKLFGEYFSLTGEGKYLLGLTGALLPLPLYFWIGFKHSSRLFIWISYLFTSLTVGFFLATIKLPIDAFYLGIIIFNATLLFLYHRYKDIKKISVLTKELPIYSQLNLVVSTILMLMFFDNEVFYSFNILLTAVLYISMVFVYDTKEYQFVFSALIAYGAYQLIENSPLDSVDILLYGFVGFIYLGFQFFYKDHEYLRKMFQYASAFISFLAFIYISYEGIIIRLEEPSILLLIAYILIAINYIYLAYLTNKNIFKFLAPIFLVVSGFQSWRILENKYALDFLEIYMFILAVLLFIALYLFNKSKYLQPIKNSSFIITLITMIGSIGLALLNNKWLDSSILLIGFGIISFLSYKSTHEKNVEKAAMWSIPVSWGLSMLIVYPRIKEIFVWYEDTFNITFHFALTGLILVAISYIWKLLKEEKIANSTFIIAIITYSIGLLLLLVGALDSYYSINNEIVRPLMLLIAIPLYLLLVKSTSYKPFWGLVAIVSLGFYSSLISTFKIDNDLGLSVYRLMAPVVLLLVYQIIGKKFSDLKPYYFWLAHIIQPIIILITLITYLYNREINPFVFVISLLVYLYSALISSREVLIKLFLYLTFTLIPLLALLIKEHYMLFKQVDNRYIFLGTSMIITIIWLLSKVTWKKRIEWYLIPFSLTGLLVIINLISGYNDSRLEVAVILFYLIFNLFFIHQRKWPILLAIPLISSLALWIKVEDRFVESTLILVGVISFFILILSGRFLFKRFFKPKYQIDMYSAVASLYLIYLGSFIEYGSPIWLKILPFALLTIFLFSQMKRTANVTIQKMIFSLGVLSLLAPYYIVIHEYLKYIPDLFLAEIISLPWIGISIFLSLKTWKEYKKPMNLIQLAILLIVATYLIIDALASNTIWDAIIIGTLSLISLISGMFLRIKSYFFVGIGVLLLNLFIQTKPFWGNLPWWIYLIIAGFTLIGIASFNEWQKQRKDSEGQTIIQVKKKMILSKFKEWK